MEIGRAGAWRHEARECVGRRLAVSPQELREVSQSVRCPHLGSGFDPALSEPVGWQ